MTTRAKINTLAVVICCLAFLNVFYQPLRIPEWLHWVFLVGIFVPLAMVFQLQRSLKKEAGATNKSTSTAADSNNSDAARQQFVLVLALPWLIGLTAPFWMPWTGTTMGPRGDLFAGIAAAIFGTLILVYARRRTIAQAKAEAANSDRRRDR